MKTGFILKGDIVYSENMKTLSAHKDSFLLCCSGISMGVFERFEDIPPEAKGFEIKDFSGMLIIPGMVDLHIHGPQFGFRGTGMDLELIPWLQRYTFPEEKKFEDPEYAEKSYALFADSMRKSATTRALIFATVHRKSTEILMDLMESSGLISYVGKINMDRESVEGLQESSFLDSAFNTFGWINDIAGRYKKTKPILTPRFIPSCSNELLNELHEIVLAYGTPVQSHLSENPDEIDWVKKLCPGTDFYAQAYDSFGLFGSLSKTVMAHCIYSGEEERSLIKKNGVFVAHCPSSNMNLSSGIAPIREYLEAGIKVGLGTDVAGGESESMFKEIVAAVQASKLYRRLKNSSAEALSFPEAFYLATLGGGEFFGKVGSFEEGYEFDALVIDDLSLPPPYCMTPEERLERAVYLSMDLIAIKAKFVRGEQCRLQKEESQ